MRIKYTEGSAALDVPGVGRVERGEVVEVPDEQGERLIKQGWQKVGGKQKSANGKAPTRPELNEKAEALGIEKPNKIKGGKPAVIEAIKAAEAAEAAKTTDSTPSPDGSGNEGE